MAENDLVERHLDNWAEWQRTSSTNLGYPKRAMVASGCGQSVSGIFEELCCAADKHAAEVMDTLINDLALDQRSAIFHHWLGCVIRVRNQQKSLEDAYDVLIVKINGRGLV